jgi:hypothetical protein
MASRGELAARAAFDVESKIKDCLDAMRNTWVQLAELIWRFREEHMYLALDHDTFEQWCESPDIGLKKRWIYRYLEIYRQLAVEREVPAHELAEVNPSYFQETLPAIRRGQVSWEEAKSDMKTLSRDDLRKAYRNVDPPQPGPKFEATGEEDFYICHACGSRVRGKFNG